MRPFSFFLFLLEYGNMINRILIWINVLLFLGLLLIFFELQSVKMTFLDDPVLQHFGEKKEDLINRYGQPDFQGSIGGPGGEILFYKNEMMSFIFAGESDVVNNLELYPGKQFLGISVGMKFDEIIKIMGSPKNRGYDPYENDYTIVYYLGKEKDGMGEVEVWFSASDDDSPTTKAQIFWKKYWR